MTIIKITTAPPCADCGEPAKVGVGAQPNVRWLCLDHYDDELRRIAKTLREALHGN